MDMLIWQFIRATGLLAYVLLSGSVFLGISINVRALDGLTKRAHVYEGHQTISVVALGLALMHVTLLFLNRHVGFTLVTALVPFASPWRPLAISMGIGALYLTATLVISTYYRSSIGQTMWRTIHYGGFAAWFMALGHGLSAGSDTDLAWVQYVYLLTAAAVTLVLIFRILAPSGRRKAPDRPATSPRTAG
jgi:predicted ferric reductase